MSAQDQKCNRLKYATVQMHAFMQQECRFQKGNVAKKLLHDLCVICSVRHRKFLTKI